MTEITPIRSRQEATLFEDNDELLLKNMTELPSTQDIEIAKFRKATEDAFRTVQQVKLEKDYPDILKPTDPVELSRVSGIGVKRLRAERVEGNRWWLEDAA